MVDDIKMTQAPVITSGFIKNLAKGHDSIHIHLNMNQSVNSRSRNKVGNESIALPMEDEALLAYIHRFPPPRLRNFINSIYRLSEQKYGKVDAAIELGCNLRTMYRQERLEQIEELGDEVI